jgi:hypothetical protein
MDTDCGPLGQCASGGDCTATDGDTGDHGATWGGGYGTGGEATTLTAG